MLKIRLLLFMILLGFVGVQAQPVIKVTGTVTDDLKNPLPKVTISIPGQNQSAFSDEKGVYNIYSTSTFFTLKYSLLGYKSILMEIRQDKAGRMVQDVVMTGNI